jgi:formate dehydrogenase maturation protein FdhE
VPGVSASPARRYGYYVWLSDSKFIEAERHDVPRGLKLEKESKGFCPICGHWSIRTNVENVETEEKSDYCTICDALFEASGLEFIDSQMCTCGHPKNYHERNALSCIKGKELVNCQCEKYNPTEVTIKETELNEK